MDEQTKSEDLWSEAFWDDRYRSRGTIWSGNVNPQLATEATGLAPGRALDAGCGEGADAIWLAERGWHVDAVDVSSVALERCAAFAREAGVDVAQRISWMHRDLTNWVPAEAAYDLVSAQFFLHMPKELRESIFRALAAAVAPGGSVLIVAHHPSDLPPDHPESTRRELFFTAPDLAALLDPIVWEIPVGEVRARSATRADGHPATVHDTVLRAVRKV